MGKIEAIAGARGGWPVLPRPRNLSIFSFYLLLLVGCVILVRRLDFGYYTPANARLPYKEAHKINTSSMTLTSPNRSTKTKVTPPRRPEFPLICLPANASPNTTQTRCPTNYPTTTTQPDPIIPLTETCPEYFRWIHEDLQPWKSKGITREMVEAGRNLAFFRLVIIDGRVHVETYKKSFQTRDVFTIWGILQLLRFYPGKLPDLDLIFECDDKPVIKKSDYAATTEEERINGTNYGPPPMFHYCGDDKSYDIPFPDWSFWGWHEINIKPWISMVKDLKEGNQRVKWENRAPYAYWKGNLHMGLRGFLVRCNSTQQWNAEIYAQRWALEGRHGFRQSNVADQCTHRYKIYMEGKSWSVSEKYIQACDSMLLLVQPRYYEFFTRSLVPLKHYWPINLRKLCDSIKFAVDWGNHHPQKAQEIGKTGSKFIMEELKMKYIYDYMFHLLNEYGKLLKYKPTVPPGAIEMCSETMACDVQGKEKQWKIESMIKGPSQTSPCSMPSHDPQHLKNFFTFEENAIKEVGRWEASGDKGKVHHDKD